MWCGPNLNLLLASSPFDTDPNESVPPPFSICSKPTYREPDTIAAGAMLSRSILASSPRGAEVHFTASSLTLRDPSQCPSLKPLILLEFPLVSDARQPHAPPPCID